MTTRRVSLYERHDRSDQTRTDLKVRCYRLRLHMMRMLTACDRQFSSRNGKADGSGSRSFLIRSNGAACAGCIPMKLPSSEHSHAGGPPLLALRPGENT